MKQTTKTGSGRGAARTPGDEWNAKGSIQKSTSIKKSKYQVCRSTKPNVSSGRMESTQGYILPFQSLLGKAVSGNRPFTETSNNVRGVAPPSGIFIIGCCTTVSGSFSSPCSSD
jgi:hypothetical protein